MSSRAVPRPFVLCHSQGKTRKYGYFMKPKTSNARNIKRYERVSNLAVFAGRGFLRNMEEIKDSPAAEKLELSLPLDLVYYPDPRLRAENLRIANFDEDLSTLAQEMFKTMYRTKGVGLAAPQVGVNVQVMVYNPEGDPTQGKEYVLVNPRVTKKSKATEMFDEACLSFPELLGEVERPSSCTVEFQDVNGKKKLMKLKGWQARIFQHEYDHLEGKLFHDRMTEDVLNEVQQQLKVFEDVYEKQKK